MRLDHISYAAGPDGLHATAKKLGDLLGASFVDGGVHPRFGTRNMSLALDHNRYLEVVEVLDHPASDKAPFGQVVRARSEMGGGWMAWAVVVDDISEVENRLDRAAVPGNRTPPNGTELRWFQIGVRGTQADPQLPFFIQWETPFEVHPAYDPQHGVHLTGLTIAGDQARVTEWLGTPELKMDGVDVSWVNPHGYPGLQSVTFTTPHGTVEI